MLHFNVNGHFIKELLEEVSAAVHHKIEAIQLHTLKEYSDLFVRLPLPASSHLVFDDNYFAFCRVAGSNPMVIKSFRAPLAKFPVTQERFITAPGFEDDDLTLAMQEGRLYIVDYEVLSALTPGKKIGLWAEGQKHVYCPIGLFGVKKGGK